MEEDVDRIDEILKEAIPSDRKYKLRFTGENGSSIETTITPRGDKKGGEQEGHQRRGVQAKIPSGMVCKQLRRVALEICGSGGRA